MLTLSLDHMMYSVFQKGLKVIQAHEDAILEEWNQIQEHFKATGKKSAKDVEITISFISDFLFSNESKELNETEHFYYLSTTKQPLSFQANHFIISLLENSVHKVIQDKEEDQYDIHQAIHYLFSKISEDLTSLPYDHYFSIDYFLRNLITSKQLPIEWAAIVVQKDDAYVVEKWFNNMDQDLLVEDDYLRAKTIYSLSELLISQMSEEKQKTLNTISLPYKSGTLLICANSDEISRITPFITYALHIFENGKESIKKQKDEHHWKDSVIMFNESIIHSNSFNEAVEAITAGYVNYLPFERCALFSYSMNEGMGFGLFGHQIDTKAIQNITEDVDNLPIIQNNLNILNLFKKTMSFIQPLYIEDASVGFPRKYVEQFQLQSIVVAPIFATSSNQLLGAAILDQGPNQHFKLTQETFSALIKFGKSAGEILSKYQQESHQEKKSDTYHLSPRELEVLKLMAEGASTTEAASHLILSEYTVRDYVSAIIQKMEARNRTEAVAKAIRKGLI